MKRLLFGAAVLLAVCGAPGLAHAAEGKDIHFSARSVTYATRELKPGALDESEFVVPTFQLLSFDGQDIGGTGVFGSASGFFGQQLGDATDLERNGDLIYGVLGWEGMNRKLRVQAGRHLVFAGAPRYLFLDGGSATVHLPANLRLDGYGGTTAFAGFEEVLEQPVYGGRLSWLYGQFTHLGAAFQNTEGHEGTARRTVGGDFSTRMMGVQLAGSYAHDLLGGALQEARLDASGRLGRWLGLYLRGELRDPIAWLPRTSIFNAFTQRTDAVVGGGFDLRTPGALTLGGGYEHFIIEDDTDPAYRGFLDARLRLDAANHYRVGVNVARLANGDNGYTQARLYGRGQVTSALTVAADIDTYWFFEEIRNEDRSIMGTLAVHWAARHGVEIGLDGQVWTNPYFRSQALGLLSVTVTDAAFRHVAAAREVPLTWGAAAEEAGGEAEEKANEKEDGNEEEKGDEPAPEGEKPADAPGEQESTAPANRNVLSQLGFEALRGVR